MPESFTMLWTNDRCKWLSKCGKAGQPLSVVFGGIHNSLPSLVKAGVRPGDRIFPVRVLKGSLYVIASMTAHKYLGLSDYVIERFHLATGDISGLHEYQIKDLLFERFPNAGQFLPYGCGTEVLVGIEGTPIRFDLAVPSHILEELTFCSKRSRSQLKGIIDGRLVSSISLQGHIRRLCPESARLIEDLVRSAGGKATSKPRSKPAKSS